MQEPWFNIDITLECGEGPRAAVSGSSLRKPWSEFQRLHYLLLTDEFGCNEAVKEKLPALPAGPAGTTGGGDGGGGSGGGGDSADIARALDAYLKALLAVPAVVQSQVFSGFMEEHSRRHSDKECEEGEEKKGGGGGGGGSGGSSGYGGEGAPRSPETAVDFLLQPFESRKVYVPRRAEHTERIDVLHGESVVWKFEVMDSLDVDFSVLFKPHPLPILSPDQGAAAAAAAAAAAVAADASAGTEGRLSSPGPRGEEGDTLPVNRASDGGNTDAGRASAAGERPPRRSGWWGRGSGDGEGGDGGSHGDTQASAEGGGRGTERDGGGRGQGPPKDRAVHLPTRYSTVGGDLVQGSFTCPADGT